MHRLLRPLLALAAAASLAGCAADAAAGGPTWVPAPSFQGEGPQPSITASSGAQPSVTPSPSASSSSTIDPAVVATNLTAPDAIAILPDGTALVGERTTGRILQVQPIAGRPVRIIRTLGGLRTSGGGGLLDLALSPDYAQDNLIFAYITTPTDNRVVDFTLTGPVTPVLTGIPRGPSDNAGRLTFGPDGQLYIGTGDAGDSAAAASTASLAGKVLRVSEIGQPSAANPDPSSPVYTTGQRGFAGLCLDSTDNVVFEVQPQGLGGLAEINVVRGGADYGWPQPRAGATKPLASVPSAYGAPGGCAVEAGVLYVTSLDGACLLAAPLAVSHSAVTVGGFTPYLVKTYGRLLTVVAAPDGALWLTTSNRDGHGKPVPTDERVLRIVAPAAGSNYPG